MKPVLLLAAFLLKVLVWSPRGQAQTTETAFACAGGTLHLSCSDGKTLLIVNATYGRTSASHTCPCTTCRTDCRANNSLALVRAACQGKQQCTGGASNDVFGGDPCPGVEKYLEVSYRCITVTDPIDLFQPRRRTKFPPSVATTSVTSSFTLDKCAEICLDSPSCLAFQWPRGVVYSNTCHLYHEVGETITDNTGDLYFKILPTQPATQPTTTQANYVPAPNSNAGPGVLAGVAIAMTVVGLVVGVGASQLVQWYRSKPKGNRSSRQADLEEEDSDGGRLAPLPLPRPDETGDAQVPYDIPTEGAPRFLRQSSGQYQELQPAQYQGLVHGDDNDDEEEYVEPAAQLAREDSTPTGNYEAVDNSYLELQA